MTSTDLAKPPGLSFRLQKGQDISFSYWALHVPDDGSVAVIHELNAHLRKHNMRSLNKNNRTNTLKWIQLHTKFAKQITYVMSNYNVQYLESSINIMRGTARFKNSDFRITCRTENTHLQYLLILHILTCAVGVVTS